MDEYCIQLKKIRADIPGFAEWTMQELKEVFDRYVHIMLEIKETGQFPNAAHLSLNSPNIRNYIEMAMAPAKTKKEKETQRGAYDNAVAELTLDIDSLIGVIGCNQ